MHAAPRLFAGTLAACELIARQKKDGGWTQGRDSKVTDTCSRCSS